jgi:hypothetical protein
MNEGGWGAGFGNLFDTSLSKKEEKKPEKAPAWNAKRIDGKYYVSLEQVVELLEMNDVLPSVRKGIERRIAND